MNTFTAPFEMEKKQVLIVILLSFSIVSNVCQGLKTSDTSKTSSSDGDISVLVRQAIKRGNDAAAAKQVLQWDRGYALEEAAGSPEGSRKEFMYNTASSFSEGDDVDRLALQGTETTIPKPSLKPTSLPVDRATDQTETAFGTSNGPSEWENDLEEDISEEGATHEKSPRDNRDESLLHGKTLDEDEDVVEEAHSPDKTNSARDDRDTTFQDVKPKITVHVHEGSFRHDTSKVRHPNMDEHHEMKRASAIRWNASHNPGDKAEDKRHKVKKRKKAHLRSEGPDDSDTSKDSDTPVIVAAICAAIMVLVLIMTGMARLWKNYRSRPHKFHDAELGLVLVSPNADCIDEQGDGEIIYESPTCHLTVLKKLTPTTTLASESYPVTARLQDGTVFYKATNCASVNADCDIESSDEEVIYERSTSQFAVFMRPATTLTSESRRPHPQETLPCYNPTNCTSVNADSDEEFSDGEIIYDSPLCQFAVLKTPATTYTTPESSSANRQASPLCYEPTNCASIDVECDEEFSDGEIIYDSPLCHVAAFKKPASAV